MFHFVTSGATRFGNISDSSSESDNEPIGLNPGKISTLYSEDCLNDINPDDVASIEVFVCKACGTYQEEVTLV